jgi:hypothetical protein
MPAQHHSQLKELQTQNINAVTVFLDIIHCPVFYLKHNVTDFHFWVLHSVAIVTTTFWECHHLKQLFLFQSFLFSYFFVFVPTTRFGPYGPALPKSYNVSETGFCLGLHVKQLGPIDRASPYLWTPAQIQPGYPCNRLWRPIVRC